MTMTEILLRTHRLGRRFGSFRALDGVDLELVTGEIRAVIGPNGAGKTTLVNALSGLTPPTSGRIYLNDREITRWPMARRARAGLVRTFQTSTLFPELSVADHLEAALGHGRIRLRRPDAWSERIEALLERSGFVERRELPAQALAHGERRRLALEMALAMRPRLLMLDEPMAGLTTPEAESFVARLRQLMDVTLLVVEHDMDVVFQLADRITVLHRGAILADGSPDEIEAEPDVQAVYLGRDAHAET